LPLDSPVQRSELHRIEVTRSARAEPRSRPTALQRHDRSTCAQQRMSNETQRAKRAS
jgi:hypothetical protein